MKPLVVFWKTISGIPSPFISATPTTVQPDEGLPIGSQPETAFPFHNQAPTCPVVVFWNTKSFCPSPLKSPEPQNVQSGKGVPTGTHPVTTVPFQTQSPMTSVFWFWKTISGEWEEAMA